MANDAERRGYYKTGYFKLCDILRVIKRDHPDPNVDEVVKKIAQEYKRWVLDVAEIDNLSDLD